MYKPEQIIEAYKPEEKRLLLEALQHSLEVDAASEDAAFSQNGELKGKEEESMSDDSTPNAKI